LSVLSAVVAPHGRSARQIAAANHVVQTFPNPSIERTVNSQLRCLSPAAHVKR